MGFALVLLLLTIGCIALILAREAQGRPRPDGLRGRIQARGWALLLLPVALAAAAMAGGAHGLAFAELALAVLAIVFAPRLAAGGPRRRWSRPRSCSWRACGCCCGWTRRARGRSGSWPPGGSTAVAA